MRCCYHDIYVIMFIFGHIQTGCISANFQDGKYYNKDSGYGPYDKGSDGFK